MAATRIPPARKYCGDINIKPEIGGVMVQACFHNAGGYCSTYKWAPAGTWTAIATNVKDYSDYYLVFDSKASASGYIAD
ncbi:hypothetical protein [Streptomyces enissocaesilis]|uniref:Uncharacterized protein n=1 Tax=Streptomyces enissocaesilis TaxID=332589 RepID=A0ABN3XQF4_9ACTN